MEAGYSLLYRVNSTIKNMADRNSAKLFGKIFKLLAENPSNEHKEIAKEIFAETRGYDFGHYQMDADDALISLGLAKKGVDPDYPEEGEVTLYVNYSMLGNLK